MWSVWIICGVIVLIVLGLSLFTTHKGYQYKHTVDPLPDETDQKKESDPDREDRR